jgi:hypothetical protein
MRLAPSIGRVLKSQLSTLVGWISSIPSRRRLERLLYSFRIGDGWWLQEYNKRRFPDGVMGYSMCDRMKHRVPQPVRTFVKKALGIAGDPKR